MGLLWGFVKGSWLTAEGIRGSPWDSGVTRLNIGALIIRIGFPLKGSLKGSRVGYYNIGAFIVRIGFWGP